MNIKWRAFIHIKAYNGAIVNWLDNSSNIINFYLWRKFGFLDDVDNTVLGIGGSLAISIGVGLFLASNPVGWSIALGAGLLIGAGIVSTYFADDLNYGWNYNRGAHFVFDIGTSMIPAGGISSVIKGTAGRVGKVVILGQDVTYITKKSYNEGIGKLLIDYSSNNGVFVDDSIVIVRYGTLGSALATAYGNTEKEIMNELYEFISYEIGSQIFDKLYFKFYGG